MSWVCDASPVRMNNVCTIVCVWMCLVNTARDVALWVVYVCTYVQQFRKKNVRTAIILIPKMTCCISPFPELYSQLDNAHISFGENESIPNELCASVNVWVCVCVRMRISSFAAVEHAQHERIYRNYAIKHGIVHSLYITAHSIETLAAISALAASHTDLSSKTDFLSSNPLSYTPSRGPCALVRSSAATSSPALTVACTYCQCSFLFCSSTTTLDRCAMENWTKTIE